MSRKTHRPVQPVSSPATPVEPAPAPREEMGCLAALARLYWVGFGNLVLFGAAVAAAKADAVLSTGAVALWAAAASLVGVRYLDVTVLNGHTSDGQRATLAHWARYAAFVVVVTGALWGLGRLVHDVIA